MTKAPRVLLIGLDAADRDLIRQWADEGALPNFRSLLAECAWGTTTSPTGLFVGAIWPSLFTGASPANHGRYARIQIRPGTYETPFFSSADLGRDPFWIPISEAGRRVAIVDVPKSPTKAIHGVHVQDWGTHDADPFATYPEALGAEIVERFGRDPVGSCNDRGETTEEVAAFLNNLEARIRTKVEMCEHFLDREAWDLFVTTFADSHCIGHQLWSLHDETHPRYDAEMARALGGDPMKRVYRALDAAVGRLLQRAGPETTVLVVSSHGMGPHYDATFLLEEILRRLDAVDTSGFKRRLVRTAEAFWRRTPGTLKNVVRPLVNRARAKREAKTGKPARSLSEALLTPDIARRRFFQVPNNDVYGAIRVNLKGREPQGTVAPGAEYDALYEELRRDLGELVNIETKKPLVRALLRSDEVYPGGDRKDGLPDFLIQWDNSAPIRGARSRKIGKIEREFAGIRTGDHKPEGIFFAKGPSIHPGELERAASIMDIAPTIGALLDVPMPGVDGRPIPALLGERRSTIRP